MKNNLKRQKQLTIIVLSIVSVVMIVMISSVMVLRWQIRRNYGGKFTLKPNQKIILLAEENEFDPKRQSGGKTRLSIDNPSRVPLKLTGQDSWKIEDETSSDLISYDVKNHKIVTWFPEKIIENDVSNSTYLVEDGLIIKDDELNNIVVTPEEHEITITNTSSKTVKIRARIDYWR